MVNAIIYASAYNIAETLVNSNKINVLKIVAEKQSVEDNLIDLAYLRNIDLFVVSSKSDLLNIPLDDVDVGVSCGFGVIFDKKFIERHAKGIINIHFGKLPEYRGRHPISFAMLDNEWKISVTAHLINHKIDQGFYLANRQIRRLLKDTPKTLSDRIISEVLQLVLDDSIHNLLHHDSFELIPPGTYHESLAKRFKENLLSIDHEAKFLFNLIKSQSIYGGICLNGQKWFNCHFCSPHVHNPRIDLTAICKDGKILGRIPL